MARFRLVETDEEGNVVREFYRSPMFPGDERNEEFRNNRIECIQGFSKKNYILTIIILVHNWNFK